MPATTLEKQVTAEQAAHDAEHGNGGQIVEPTGQTAAFDRSSYEDPALRIAKVDDRDIDKIRVDFTGSVMLDRKTAADVALYNRLQLGKPVELRVAGVTSAKATGYTTGKEGDLDAVVGKTTVKIDTVYVLDPGELE